jgi:uncharacterized protein YndB with AHSA1/START domain
MTATASALPVTRAIVIEELLPHSPEAVWRAITTPELIARWLMQNDFAPRVGHRFKFQARPMGDWNGVVDCEVLECDPPRRLVYSWVGGAEGNRAAPALDSTLTLTLAPVDGDTRLRLVHDGFRSPQNDAGYDAMREGWASMAPRISQIIAESA